MGSDAFSAAVIDTELYVGEHFTTVYQPDSTNATFVHYIAKWNGTSWSGVGSQLDEAGVFFAQPWAMVAKGTELYAGGHFDNETFPIAYLAKWDGAHWSLIAGLNGDVYAIAVKGDNLYVGGAFTEANGNSNAKHIAKWNGTSWSALRSGLNDDVYAIATSGNDLYVDGKFTDAGGDVNADYVAKWDGAAWSALGSGVNGAMHALAVYPAGGSMIIGGEFISPDTLAAKFTDSGNALPVQLISFTATADRLTAQLHWSTATKTNAYGFDVERRWVGKNSGAVPHSQNTLWTKVVSSQVRGRVALFISIPLSTAIRAQDGLTIGSNR